jgi:hypothetical protein
MPSMKAREKKVRNPRFQSYPSDCQKVENVLAPPYLTGCAFFFFPAEFFFPLIGDKRMKIKWGIRYG